MSRESDKPALRQQLLQLLSGQQPYTAVAREMVKRKFGASGLAGEFGTEVSNLAGEIAVPAAAVLEEATGSSSSPVRRPELADPGPPSPPLGFPGCEKLPPFAQDRIRRVEIRNFKAIESLDLDFPEAQVDEDDAANGLMLIGENATGKSSVLEAIALALLGTEQIGRLGLKAADFLRRDEEWRSPPNTPAQVRVYFEDALEPVSLVVDPHTATFQGNTSPAVVLAGYGPRRFFTDRRGLRRRRAPYARVKTLFEPTTVITNPSGWLMNCGDAQFSAAVRALRQLLLLPDEAVVRRPPPGERSGAAVMFDMHGILAPLNRLSEGYRTIAATSIDVMREMLRYWPALETARGVVLIDELETHLHPRWKMRIVQRLRRAMPQVQFIATTHDPLCLRGLFDGEVKVLRRTDSSGIEQLMDLPNVQGLSVEQLLTSDYFGLFSTEDPKLEEEITRYVALATKQDRTAADEIELAQHRAAMRKTLRVGMTPEHQLVQDAISQYLVTRRTAPDRERGTLRQEALERILEVWKSLGKPDEAT